MRPTVYLAGPITGLSYEGCTDWRAKAREWLAQRGIRGISPMRGKDYLANEQNVSDAYDDAAEKVTERFGRMAAVLSTGKAIVARDRFDCQRADIVIANVLGAQAASIGTMIELGWADSARVPVILVIEGEGNPHDHGMVREVCGFRAENLDEALHVAAAVLEEGT